ncbi:hypothetical protein [Rhizobium leguminosarum]|nr:hypothetical protein [Rhizobium leguminosarum]
MDEMATSGDFTQQPSVADVGDAGRCTSIQDTEAGFRNISHDAMI